MRTPIALFLLTATLGCQAPAGPADRDATALADATSDAAETTDTPGEPIEAALTRLNAQRELSGLQPVTVTEALSAGCADHVAYMRGEAKVVHDQDPASPHHTARGAATGPNALIAGHVDDFGQAVDLWLIELYQRVNLLDPGVREVGVAFDDGYACLDLFTAWEDPGDFSPVPWPAGTQTGVPTSYEPRSGANPVPATYSPPTGPPISLTFAPEAVVDPKFKATLLDDDGALVEAFVRLPHDPTDPYATLHRNTVALIPLAPLAPGRTFTVSMTGAVDGAQTERQWSFQTRP